MWQAAESAGDELTLKEKEQLYSVLSDYADVIADYSGYLLTHFAKYFAIGSESLNQVKQKQTPQNKKRLLHVRISQVRTLYKFGRPVPHLLQMLSL